MEEELVNGGGRFQSTDGGVVAPGRGQGYCTAMYGGVIYCFITNNMHLLLINLII